MPPEITAGLTALAGAPPGRADAGKTTAGPPGTATAGPNLLKTTLFAAVLAQTGEPDARSPVFSLPTLMGKDPLPEKTPTAKKTSPRVGSAPVTAPQELNLPVIKTWRTMDILPKSSPLVSKTEKDKADELPPRKAAVSNNAAAVKVTAELTGPGVKMPVLAPVLPVSLTLVLPVSLTPVLDVRQPPASTIQVKPGLASSAASATQALLRVTPQPSVLAAAPVDGLALPRTFPVASPVTLPSAAPPVSQSAVPASAPSDMWNISAITASSPVVTGQAARPVPGDQAKRTLSVAEKTVTATDSTGTGQASSATLAGVQVEAPKAVAAVPEAVAAAPQATPDMTGDGSAVLKTPPAQPGTEQVVSQSPGRQPPEMALKPLTQDADINTRMSGTSVAAVEAPAPAGVRQTSRPAAEASAPKSAARTVPVTSKIITDLLPTMPAPAASTGAETLPSKPLSAADRAEIVRQAADGLQALPLLAKPGGVQQMSLQLHPKDWGSLQVSVTVSQGPETGAPKTVTAHIVAENPQVKAALQSQNGALHQALRASGLTLEHLTVSVKVPEPKAVTIKPPSESASAGFASDPRQPGAGGQPNLSSSQQQAGPSTGFAAFGGSGQEGRQGQPPQAATLATALTKQEENITAPQPLRPLAGRVDTHA